MTNHLLAAAQHARTAAFHAATAGSRASYWSLLSEAETLAGDPAFREICADLARKYEQGLLQPPV